MVAEHDYTPLAWKQQMLESMPLAELVIVENSHHATPVEHPIRFNELVSGCLASVGAGNTPMSDQADAAGSSENAWANVLLPLPASTDVANTQATLNATN